MPTVLIDGVEYIRTPQNIEEYERRIALMDQSINPLINERDFYLKHCKKFKAALEQAHKHLLEGDSDRARLVIEDELFN